jgi:4-amino-4-deoxy-L-arabinose transferase-like glycosyltransferase
MERGVTHWLPQSRWWLAGLALILATQISCYWYPTPDACSYLSMARSVAHGNGLRNLGSPHLWYPPGYAVLISPLFWLSDRPFLAISVFHWVAMVLFMLGVYVWVRQNAPGAAPWITALCVINLTLWRHIRCTLTEVTFITILIWTANSLRAAVTAATPRGTAWRALAAILLMGLLCLVRQAGITLAGGFGVYALLSARAGRISWRKALLLSVVVAATATAAVSALVVREHCTAQSTGRRTYLDNFRDSAHQWEASCLQGLQMCISEDSRVALPGVAKSYGPPGQWFNVNMLLYVPFFLFLLWGCWRWQLRELDPLACALPFYIGLHTVYAIDSGARFAVPLIPPMMVSLWYALEALGTQRRVRLFAVAALLHLVMAAGYWVHNDLPLARALAAQWPAIDTFAASIQADPGPTAVVHDVPMEIAKMLDLAVDRRATENFDRLGVRPAIRWLLTPRCQPVPPGFVLKCAAGDYQLLQSMAVAADHNG